MGNIGAAKLNHLYLGTDDFQVLLHYNILLSIYAGKKTEKDEKKVQSDGKIRVFSLR